MLRCRSLSGTLEQWVVLVGVLALLLVYGAILKGYPVIRGDGLGYYLYVPAACIDQDLTLRQMAKVHFQGAIPSKTGAQLWPSTGNYLICYPPGVAILELPFFGLGCLLALLAGQPMDGFAWPFQFAVALAGLFYLGLGVLFLRRFLEKDYGPVTAGVTILAMVFGTNCFHYATFDASYSHVYSFFLLSTFLWAVRVFYRTGESARGVVVGLLAGMIVLTRITNAIWLLWLPLCGIGGIKDLESRFAFWRRRIRPLSVICGVIVLLLALQVSYWKFVTGYWFVTPYKDAYFTFANPHLFEVLLGSRRGLLVWSPILLVSLGGLWFLWGRRKDVFWMALAGLSLHFLIVSSWYYWDYGCSYGHRAFVDAVPLFGLCYGALLHGLGSRARRCLLFVTVILIAMQMWLMLKYWLGTIPFEGPTFDYFIMTFFSLRWQE